MKNAETWLKFDQIRTRWIPPGVGSLQKPFSNWCRKPQNNQFEPSFEAPYTSLSMVVLFLSKYEICSYLSCKDISDISTWQMWRNRKFVHICYEKIFKISPHDRCGEFRNYSTCGEFWNSPETQIFFSDLRCFVEIYTLLCGEKFTQKMLMWRKLQILGMFWGNCGITKFNLTSPLKPVWLWRRDILGEVKHKLHKLLSGWPDLHLGAAETILKACLTQWNVERQGILGEVNISVVDIDLNIFRENLPRGQYANLCLPGYSINYWTFCQRISIQTSCQGIFLAASMAENNHSQTLERFVNT